MTDAVVVDRESDDRRNMTPFDEIVLEIDDLYGEAQNWADGTPIESQEQCDALDVLDKALLDADKRREVIRKDEAKPFDDGKAAVQAKHNPVKDKVARARASLNPLRTAWKEREQKRKEAIAAKERQEAEAARIEAERLMRESAGDLAAREDAEHMLASAKLAEADAKKATKAATTRLGLRAAWVPTLTDRNAAIKHYWAKAPEAFERLVIDMAQRDVRAGIRSIPGFQIIEEKRAI